MSKPVCPKICKLQNLNVGKEFDGQLKNIWNKCRLILALEAYGEIAEGVNNFLMQE